MDIIQILKNVIGASHAKVIDIEANNSAASSTKGIRSGASPKGGSVLIQRRKIT